MVAGARMTMLDYALDLVHRGFYVFPIKRGAKDPPLCKFTEQATRDEHMVRAWFGLRAAPPNIGIFTGRFRDNEACVVLDVDNKNAIKGDDTLVALQFEQGLDVPPTFTQLTPTSGRHIVYRVPQPLRQPVGFFPSIDVRSKNGYIVGAGSVIGEKQYSVVDYRAVAAAPAWLVARLSSKTAQKELAVRRTDDLRARTDLAIKYLDAQEPASEGERNDKAYALACGVRDYSVEEGDARTLLEEHWNVRCVPSLSSGELQATITHAYHYGQNAPGAALPHFEKQPSAVIRGMGGEIFQPPNMGAMAGIDRAPPPPRSTDHARRAGPADIRSWHLKTHDRNLILEIFNASSIR